MHLPHCSLKGIVFNSVLITAFWVYYNSSSGRRVYDLKSKMVYPVVKAYIGFSLLMLSALLFNASEL